MVYIVMIDDWCGNIMHGGNGGRPIAARSEEASAEAMAASMNEEYGSHPDEPYSWVVELELDKEVG